MTGIPVSPEVLQWARDFRRLSEEDAAARLGVTVEYLRALEAGTERPTLTLFENIAAKYRLPQSTLFRRTRPKNPPEPTDYRTLGGIRQRQTFDLGVAISNARTLLNQLQRIADDDAEYRAPKLPSYHSTGDAAELGERERNRLGVLLETQKGWRDSAEAFRQWRRIVEGQGVSVFTQKFPLSDCRGFTIFEAGKLPCIIVNKEEKADVAKIFTLIHEYCHLLIRKPGISDENPTNRVEAFCNRFAAGFLMPRNAIRELLGAWPNEPVEWPAADIETWARQLKVSRQALAIRLEELNLAPLGFNRKFAAKTPVPKQRKPTQVSGVTTRISEIGSNYARVVLGAYDRQAITLADAVEAIGLSPRHLNRVREAIKPRGDAGV